MTDLYYVIWTHEDGVSINVYNKPSLLQWIQQLTEEERLPDISTELPSDPDPLYWGTNLVIIKGHLVQPVARRKVVEYDIE